MGRLGSASLGSNGKYDPMLGHAGTESLIWALVKIPLRGSIEAVYRVSTMGLLGFTKGVLTN